MKPSLICPHRIIYLYPNGIWATTHFIIHKRIKIPKPLVQYAHIITEELPPLYPLWLNRNDTFEWKLGPDSGQGPRVYQRGTDRVGIQDLYYQFFQQLFPQEDFSVLHGDTDPYQFWDHEGNLLISIMSFRLKG